MANFSGRVLKGFDRNRSVVPRIRWAEQSPLRSRDWEAKNNNIRGFARLTPVSTSTFSVEIRYEPAQRDGMERRLQRGTGRPERKGKF